MEASIANLPPKPPNELWPGQSWMLHDRTKPQHMVVSGVGYGKTQFGCRWHFLRASEFNKHCEYSYIGAPKEGLLKHGILPRYRELLNDLGLSANKPFSDYTVTTSSGSMAIKFAWGHTALLQTMHESSARSVVAVTGGHAWVDECGLTSDLTPTEMTKRTRDPLAGALQTLYTGTPEGITGWYAEMLLDQELQRRGRFSVSKNCVVLHGRTFDNKYNHKQYLQNLYRNLGWDKNLIRAYIHGEVVPIYQTAGYDFDAGKHTLDVEPQTDRTLYLGWDFNVMLTSWIGVQECDGDLIAVAENKRNARGTLDACNEFIKQFPPSKWGGTEIVVYGDRSGYSRDTRSYTDDYQIIKQALSPHYPLLSVRARKSNPSISLRIACVNRLFSGAYTSALYIAQRCDKLQESLRTTVVKPTGEIEKPSGDIWTHKGDALGYVIVELRPIKKLQSGEVPIVL